MEEILEIFGYEEWRKVTDIDEKDIEGSTNFRFGRNFRNFFGEGSMMNRRNFWVWRMDVVRMHEKGSIDQSWKILAKDRCWIEEILEIFGYEERRSIDREK